LYAQRKASAAPRSRFGYNRPVPTRVRMGLVMRKGMDFGELGDMEPTLRAEGVGLAPISTGDASLISGGVTVLATATAADIADGRVKGLVVPGGASDEAGLAAVRSLLDLAKSKSLPVLAFADAVTLASETFGVAVDAPGALFSAGKATPVRDPSEVSALVAGIS